MDLHVLAQIVMVVVLVLMISGRTPLYLTAIIGSSLVALVAGFPITGSDATSMVSLVKSGLNPVIADMVGILLFLGVLESSGFLAIIVQSVIRVGIRMGGGPGVCAASSIAAGTIGMLTGFTNPVVTGAIGGPAAIKMGVNPNQAAGSIAHAGALGNFGGFTHPTQVALVAAAGIGFGMINIIGVFCALVVIGVSFIRMYFSMKKNNQLLNKDEIEQVMEQFNEREGLENVSAFKAFLPFVLLLAGFSLGFPVFIVGILCGLLVIILAHLSLAEGEKMMMAGVQKIAIPVVATIGFLYMSSVIKHIGLADTVGDFLSPLLSVSPILVMLLVSILAGLVTQSYGASAAVSVPMLSVVIGAGADPLAATVAAAGGSALMQHFLTGGPVAALPTLMPVCEGSEQKLANRFQRPSILCGVLAVIVISFLLNAAA